MTKGTYYIRHSKGVESRTGWIMGDWGLTREKTGWVATDLTTGTSYNTFGYPTRAALVEAIAQDTGRIAQAKQTEYYTQLVAFMQDAVKRMAKEAVA